MLFSNDGKRCIWLLRVKSHQKTVKTIKRWVTMKQSHLMYPHGTCFQLEELSPSKLYPHKNEKFIGDVIVIPKGNFVSPCKLCPRAESRKKSWDILWFFKTWPFLKGFPLNQRQIVRPLDSALHWAKKEQEMFCSLTIFKEYFIRWYLSFDLTFVL